MEIDFNKPAGKINLEEKLSIKSIKYILNNLKWNRAEYNRVQEFWAKQGSNIKDIDFDLIEALQNIFKYCDNNVLLCKMANVFNLYVETFEDIGLYESYGYGEDKIYSCGYDLTLNVPAELREKIIKASQKIMDEYEQKYNEYNNWW